MSVEFDGDDPVGRTAGVMCSLGQRDPEPQSRWLMDPPEPLRAVDTP